MFLNYLFSFKFLFNVRKWELLFFCFRLGNWGLDGLVNFFKVYKLNKWGCRNLSLRFLGIKVWVEKNEGWI